MSSPPTLYIAVSQLCEQGNCNCLEKDGAPVSEVGHPPFHHGCTCVAVEGRPPVRLRAEISAIMGTRVSAPPKLPKMIRLEGLAYALWLISPSSGLSGTLEVFRTISPRQRKYWTEKAEGLELGFSNYIKLIGGRKP